MGAWLETAYLVVACVLGLRVLLGVGLSLRILARASRIDPEWAAGLRVRLSRDVAGPVTIARTIVLPTHCVAWPAETRHAVLAHEHAHVSRLDYAMLVVSQLNRAVFWFSPLSWWLHHRLAVLTELVSDDRAIEVTRDRVGYAEILLAIAQRSGPTAQGPSMAHYSTLPLRIDRILLDPMTPYGVSRLHWATLTLGVAAVSVMVAKCSAVDRSKASGDRSDDPRSRGREACSGSVAQQPATCREDARAHGVKRPNPTKHRARRRADTAGESGCTAPPLGPGPGEERVVASNDQARSSGQADRYSRRSRGIAGTKNGRRGAGYKNQRDDHE